MKSFKVSILVFFFIAITILYQPHIQTSVQFLKESPLFIENYNTVRAQHYLRGNTPEVTYQGKTVSISHYNAHFVVQKDLRKTQNQANKCEKCI